MKVIDEGVIKYKWSNFTHSGAIDLSEYSELEYWRKKLFDLGLIGEYAEEALGYGNVSIVQDYLKFHKTSNPQFIITGTQTGKYPELDGNFYTRVLDYNIENLEINIMGPIPSSSEALTHAAIYSFNPNIKVVLHIHSQKIWKAMIEDHSDFTAENIPYGTVEMAHATQKCVENKDYGIFCMHGHLDGVVAYGRNLEEAGELILRKL